MQRCQRKIMSPSELLSETGLRLSTRQFRRYMAAGIIPGVKCGKRGRYVIVGPVTAARIARTKERIRKFRGRSGRKRLRYVPPAAQTRPTRLYDWSMKYVTEAAIRSANAAYEKLQQTDGATRQGDEAAILNHLQNVIGMGAALSRYFWPVRPARRQRGELLRAQFKVTDASPLK